MLKLLFVFLLPFSAFAQSQHGWGVNLFEGKKGIRIGGRLQGVIESESQSETQDFYLRRTRLNITYSPWEDHLFVYDIRNDNANKADEGENDFNIGDAYWKINTHHSYFINNIKFFRSKVDVSYTQTSSSKNLFNPLRPGVAEHASDFVVHNRRAANIQANGNIKDLAFQVAVSDGVQSSTLKDISGNEVDSVVGQKFTYGAKLRYFFVGDAQKNKVQDTFYGNRDTLSLGIGHFRNDKIIYEYNLKEKSINRSLTNIEFSLALNKVRVLAEYFQMQGDLINLAASNPNDVLGESGGHYGQVEYFFGKWAPYYTFEEFDRNKSADDYKSLTQTFGINYYALMEAKRFGVAFKQTEQEKNLGNSQSEQFFCYLMLNF